MILEREPFHSFRQTEMTASVGDRHLGSLLAHMDCDVYRKQLVVLVYVCVSRGRGHRSLI